MDKNKMTNYKKIILGVTIFVVALLIPLIFVFSITNVFESKYQITIEIDGREQHIEVTYGKTFELPVPTKEGYTFTGWYLDNVKITDSNGKSLSEWNYTENKTLKANYTVNNTYTDVELQERLNDLIYDVLGEAMGNFSVKLDPKTATVLPIKVKNVNCLLIEFEAPVTNSKGEADDNGYYHIVAIADGDIYDKDTNIDIISVGEHTNVDYCIDGLVNKDGFEICGINRSHTLSLTDNYGYIIEYLKDKNGNLYAKVFKTDRENVGPATELADGDFYEVTDQTIVTMILKDNGIIADQNGKVISFILNDTIVDREVIVDTNKEAYRLFK